MMTVLVIDDEEEVLDSISLILKAVGYHVVKARDGEEGIRKFHEHSFDIVITDLFMPSCNGDEMARHVRREGKGIPVIGITGNPWDMDLGCFDIVMKKPFSLKKLVEYIKTVGSPEERVKAN
jgi:CheY-like chemotaxis protein